MRLFSRSILTKHDLILNPFCGLPKYNVEKSHIGALVDTLNFQSRSDKSCFSNPNHHFWRKMSPKNSIWNWQVAKKAVFGLKNITRCPTYKTRKVCKHLKITIFIQNIWFMSRLDQKSKFWTKIFKNMHFLCEIER